MPHRKLWRLWTSQRVMGIVMLLLTVVSGVTMYIQTERTNQISVCIAAYQAGFSRALQARTVSQGSFNDSLNHLIITVAESTSPQEVRNALQEYVIAANKRDADLKANPYPEPPVCK